MTFKQLPTLRAREVIKAIERIGFVLDRQKGSHAIYIHPKTKARAVIPIHPGKTIKKPLLMAIIKDAGLKVNEFLELLSKQTVF
ncbi:MAG: type II toxin-antitoxin system HicA family toxin [Patescibacteria group bacterium]